MDASRFNADRFDLIDFSGGQATTLFDGEKRNGSSVHAIRITREYAVGIIVSLTFRSLGHRAAY